MTRARKIRAILDTIEDWDLDHLIEWVQREMKKKLEALSDEDLDAELDASGAEE